MNILKSRKRPQAGSGRDLFGIAHGSAGKGDKNRVSDTNAFRVNYELIDWRDVNDPSWLKDTIDDKGN